MSQHVRLSFNDKVYVSDANLLPYAAAAVGINAAVRRWAPPAVARVVRAPLVWVAAAAFVFATCFETADRALVNTDRR